LETTYAIELYREVPEPSDRGPARFTWSLKRDSYRLGAITEWVNFDMEVDKAEEKTYQ
jgi:hypothetical protein